MHEQLMQGIVCILRADGSAPIGTGFVVSEDGLIATCAHVIGWPLPERVRVLFWATNEQREARVRAEWWRSQETEDIAILQIDGDLPQGVQSLPLGTSAGTVGHTIHTFGFPIAGEVEGIRGMGEVLGLGTKTKNGQLLLQVRSNEITQGFSGAPIWDVLRRRVIGMVVIVAKPDTSGKLGETAFATPTETLRIVCPPLHVSEVCPYPGLVAFTENDAEFFFGREQIIAGLVNRLRREPRFLTVLGASGSGKSSVVQAGLIPQLRKGKVPGSDCWEIIVTHPADDPYEELAKRGLANASNDLTERVQEWLKQHSERKRFMLVVDQFEELLVISPEGTRRDFIRQLAKLLKSPLPITIVLMMRDDFYSRLVQHEALVEWLESTGGPIHVSRTLKRDELIDIVQKPAEAVGLKFEEGLVETIVKDAMGSPADPENGESAGRSTILPLLEFALNELWKRCRDGLLTHQVYNTIGGVAGSLTQWADRAYYSLMNEEDQHLARRIFTDLVHLGDERQGLPDSRRRRSLSTLYRNKIEREKVYQIIWRLTEADARLLVTTRSLWSNEETVEIIHDALLQEWGQLKQWLLDDRHFLMWHQELEGKVRAWVKTNPDEPGRRDEDQLLRGRELIEAKRWLSERLTDLNQTEIDFIQVSQERQEREEKRRKLYEEADSWRQETEQRRQVALARQLVAEAKFIQQVNLGPNVLQDSVLLAVEAIRRNPSAEAYQVLRNGLALLPRNPVIHLVHREAVNAVAFSPDDRYLATAANDGTVRLWETASGNLVNSLLHNEDRSVLGRALKALSFSPDGRYLATAAEDGIVAIWKIAISQRLSNLYHRDSVNAVAFSPDGHHIATASSDGFAGIWKKIGDLQFSYPYHEGPVNSVAFSPDGRYIATASSDGSAGIWGAAREEQLALLRHEGPVNSVAFSPDGRYIATASSDGSAGIWGAAGGRQVALLTHTSSVNAVLFSQDGHYLATASDDGSVRVWEITGRHRLVSMIHESSMSVVNAIAFSPDSDYLAAASGVPDPSAVFTEVTSGHVGVWNVNTSHRLFYTTYKGSMKAVAFSHGNEYLAAAGDDGTAGIWKKSDELQLAHLTHKNYVNAVAFSPDGHYLATASSDHTVGVWETATGHQNVRLNHQGVVNAVVFSSNGQYLATASADATARIWETRGGRQLSRLMHESAVRGVVFSQDGHYIATGSWDGTARVWESSSQKELTCIHHRGAVNAVTFSLDGNYLATASSDGSAKIWEVASNQELAHLEHDGSVNAVAFSADGCYLATASDDGTVRMWGTSDGSQRALLVHEGIVYDVVFSRDNKYLATASGDRTAGLWETTGGNRIASLSHEGIVWTVAFSSDSNYLATASRDGTAGVWEISNSRQLARLSHDRSVKAVTFSPDRRYIATASEDGTAVIWLWRPEDLIAEACCRLTRNLTEVEWRHYLGDEPYRKTCTKLP